METREEHDGTGVVFESKRTKFHIFQHALSFTNHLFYREDEDRRMEMKRCVARGCSYGG